MIEKIRIYKSIWALFALGLMSMLPIGVSLQTVQGLYDSPTIWVCIFFCSMGMGMLSLQNKMFPKLEAGF